MNVVAYLVRHGEVEHHRTDVALTARGRTQAEAAGVRLATHIADGDTVIIRHSPVTRVAETAELVRAGLSAALACNERANGVHIAPLQSDLALSNVRFILGPGREPEEPSLLHEQMNTLAFLQTAPPAHADFYRGFWTSADPMGYWLTHDSAGAAEMPEVVLRRLLRRLDEVLHDNAGEAGLSHPGRMHWVGLTHSGAMRVLLRLAFGADPGEPDYCAIITVEPGSTPGRATLSYRDQRAALSLAGV
jgi:broad specificity phosphatase PhoE